MKNSYLKNTYKLLSTKLCDSYLDFLKDAKSPKSKEKRPKMLAIYSLKIYGVYRYSSSYKKFRKTQSFPKLLVKFSKINRLSTNEIIDKNVRGLKTKFGINNRTIENH